MSLVGDFKEILFADLLQFYCLGGQTAAVSVKASDERGSESSGTFFIDGGVLVDACFDGREGADAVRRAVRRLKHGAFQVALGARSERRTVHEPWSALVLEELRQRDGEERVELFAGLRSAAPSMAAAFASGAARLSTPRPSPEWNSAFASHPRTPVPPAGMRVAHPPAASHASTPSQGAAVVVGSASAARAPTPVRGPSMVAVTPPRGTPAMHAAPSVARPVAPGQPASVARAVPGSGPHLRSSGSGARPAPPTEPFPRLRRELLPGGLTRWFLVVGGALLTGGALAVVAAQLLARSEASPERGSVAAPRASAAPTGVTDTEVVFGMAAPFTGASRELGRQMKVGVEVAFAAANAEGGVHGRQVRLIGLDDGYEPARTGAVVRELAEQRGVFGFVGNVGTPTAAVALPYTLRRQMLFFGPLTGAPLLRRDPPDRTVFNYRASYAEETAAIVRYLVEVRRIRPDQIAVFAQDDSYGEAGYQGVLRSLGRVEKGLPSVLRVTYPRNTADVASAVARIVERGDRVRAVVMVATYRAAARFIEQVKNRRPQTLFASVSFVGTTALAGELMQLGPRFAAGVIVSQVVPLPTSRSSAVLRYQGALAAYAPGERPDFVSLEGYVVGNLLLEGLRRSGRTVTTENMVRALETIRGLDLGLGTTLGFGPTEHQGSHRVWGTVLDGTGNILPLDLE